LKEARTKQEEKKNYQISIEKPTNKPYQFEANL
jgi:hypothetical protein